MAFTFAHPAAVIPLQKHKNKFDFTALVFGSMAPDFEYFLFGKPMQIAGHTIWGMFTVNLPLVLAVWVLYEAFVRDVILRHMPISLWKFAQTLRRPPRCIRHAHEAWVFVYSAILGMLTHLLWDACTHQTGFIVEAIPLLQQSVPVLGYALPVYKGLQHGSTLLGLFYIVLFFNSIIKSTEVVDVRILETKKVWRFWVGIIGISGIFFSGFWLLFFDGSLGGLVIGILDSLFLSVLCMAVADRFSIAREIK